MVRGDLGETPVQRFGLQLRRERVPLEHAAHALADAATALDPPTDVQQERFQVQELRLRLSHPHPSSLLALPCLALPCPAMPRRAKPGPA
jgi:hypothetical protein